MWPLLIFSVFSGGFVVFFKPKDRLFHLYWEQISNVNTTFGIHLQPFKSFWINNPITAGPLTKNNYFKLTLSQYSFWVFIRYRTVA